MAKKLSRGQLRQTFELVRPFWPHIAGVSAIIVLIALVNQAYPLINRALFDLLTGRPGIVLFWQATNFWVLLGAMLFFKIILTLLDRISTYFSRLVGAKIQFHLRGTAFSHLLMLPVEYFNRNPSGKVMSRVARGSDAVKGIISNIGIHVLPSVVTAVISIFVVLSFSWTLGLATIAMFIPFFWLRYRRFKATEKLERRQHKLWDIEYSHFYEVLANNRLVKIFNAQGLERNEFLQTTGKLLRGMLRIERVNNRGVSADLLLDVWTMALYGFVFYRGSIGLFTVGTVVLLIQYIEMIKKPLWNLNWILWEVKHAQIGIYDYLKILGTKPSLVESETPIVLAELEGRVEFRDVYFKYPEKSGQEVFRGISFAVEPGETLALVGRSGVGKTTIAHLLVRFFDPNQGLISLDGVGLKELSGESLHHNVGLVMQESYLYDDTIANNLRYGNPSATPAQMKAACEIANAWEFIKKLPKKLETVIGERGIRLSGGQKQRLSIARTVLQDPRVLILDEATSALDSHSEQLVQQALERLSRGRTTIIIAHRLSTIRRADKILVLDKQTIAEQGTHQELLKKNGLYSSLHRLQTGKLKEWDLVS